MAGRCAACRIGCPKAEAPSTQTVRVRSGGSTGSHVSWAFAGWQQAADFVLVEADGSRRPAFYAVREALAPLCLAIRLDRTAFWPGTHLSLIHI